MERDWCWQPIDPSVDASGRLAGAAARARRDAAGIRDGVGPTGRMQPLVGKNALLEREDAWGQNFFTRGSRIAFAVKNY